MLHNIFFSYIFNKNFYIQDWWIYSLWDVLNTIWLFLENVYPPVCPFVCDKNFMASVTQKLIYKFFVKLLHLIAFCLKEVPIDFWWNSINMFNYEILAIKKDIDMIFVHLVL